MNKINILWIENILYNNGMNIDDLKFDATDKYIKESELFARGWSSYKKKWYLWGGKELTKKDEDGNVLYLREMIEQVEHVHRKDFEIRRKKLNEIFQTYGKCKLRRY